MGGSLVSSLVAGSSYKHNHTHCELITNSDMPDSGKKLEHMEDELGVMASLMLSVKDRIKIG